MFVFRRDRKSSCGTRALNRTLSGYYNQQMLV
jgi:hypothetical protein